MMTLRPDPQPGENPARGKAQWSTMIAPWAPGSGRSRANSL